MMFLIGTFIIIGGYIIAIEGHVCKERWTMVIGGLIMLSGLLTCVMEVIK
jgi:hypothetical protein